MSAPFCGTPGSGGLTVGAVLRRFLPTSSFPASPHTRAVLRRLSRCHTGQGGWTLWQCEACSQAHWRPKGCGNRHCPECTSRAREQWLVKQRSALLPVRNYHWVFTLPAGLRPLALQNQKAIYTLLFDAASETLLRFGEERLGARLGITALLHTWGQTLMEHPHLHCLVTGGGLALQDNTKWVGPKQARYLFPVKAVAKMFAGKFLAGLQSLRSERKLEYHGRLKDWADPGVWERTLRAMGGGNWVVFGKGSVGGPDSVLEYLGRYTHRVAISNGRLLGMNSQTVSFRYKDYKSEGAIREMTLAGAEFVRRLALHILPAGFTKIRHYGILGNNRRAKMVPLAVASLEKSRWRMELAPVKALPKVPAPSWVCEDCGSEDLVCMGQYGTDGKLHALRKGAKLLLVRMGLPPRPLDDS